VDFRYSTEQELFRQSVRDWATKNLEPRARQIDKDEAGIPDDIVQGMVDLGIFGVTIPEELGGCSVPGEELTYAMIAIHELARGDLSMSTPVYTLLTIGWSYIVNKYGTQQLKEEVLPQVAEGKCFVGINTTEPGGGSDLARIKTRAEKRDGTYYLTGEKAYVSGPKECMKLGPPSGHCSLVVTDPSTGHKGLTFMYIPAHADNITWTVYEDMGRMGLSTGGWVYKDTPVPEYNLLGEEGKGFYVVMDGFNAARVLVAAACLGGAEKCLDISADYNTQRTTFGKPLIKNEGISFEMVNDWMQLDMLKLNLQRGAWMIGYESQNPGTFSRKDINKVIATCKCLSPTLGHDVARHGMTYHGAFGYTKDTPLEMALRGVMSYEVGAEGGLNIMRGIIARDLWGDAANPFKD
jgi:acyl-CoA dehydrogenase